LMHAAGCAMSSSEQMFVPFLAVRDGRPGSAIGEGLGDGDGLGDGEGDGGGVLEPPTIVMCSSPVTP
jgi:hypothetical protein